MSHCHYYYIIITLHPIQVEVGHPSEVDEIFDNISYNKGASVIRMLYNWIGGLALVLGFG